jgi:hypothetical protein
VVDDRDYRSTLLLVEDNQNYVESTLATLSKGRPIEGVYITRDREEALDFLLRRAACWSQAAENAEAGLPGQNHQPSRAAEREL